MSSLNGSQANGHGEAKPGRMLRYVDALREAVAQEMERDPRVFVFGLDVDDHKAIQGSTRGLLERFGAERVFRTPLSEDAMTGVAIGAAMAGMRPIHVHIRMDFLMLCMNQLVNIAAKARYMYGGSVSVPMVVRSMIGKSWGQGAQHSQGLYSMFMHVPGLKVVAPSNAYDAKGCLIAAIRDDNPVIFVEHRLLYPTEASVPEEPYRVEFGRARVMRHGEDITIVGISNMVVECLRAHELLADVGITAEVIDPDLTGAARHRHHHPLGRAAPAACWWSTTPGPTAARAPRSLRALPSGRCTTAPFAASAWALRRRLARRRRRSSASSIPTRPRSRQAAHKLVRPGDAAWSPDPHRAELAYQVQFRGPF